MKSLLIVLVVLMLCSQRAIGYDLATESTQIMNNIELVLSAARQLQSLVNEAQMIQNQIEQLKSIATYQNSWATVDSNRTTLFNLVNQGVAISNQIQTQLTQMQQQTEALINTGTLSDQQALLGQNTLSVVQATLARINQSRQNYQTQENGIQDLLQKNNQVIGQTQALQVLNQVSTQNITQMQATQELLNNLATLEATKMVADYEDKKSQSDRLDQIIHPVTNSTSSFDFGT